MRIKVVLIYSVFFISCRNIENSPATLKTTNVRFEPDTCNFGNIQRGDSATAEFKYFNEGDFPLQIKKIGYSCGCTKAEYDTSKVLPGGYGIIKIKYASREETGTILKTLIVECNTNPTLNILFIKGMVRN